MQTLIQIPRSEELEFMVLIPALTCRYRDMAE